MIGGIIMVPYDDAIKMALDLWEKHALKYRTLRGEYEGLLAEKRKLGLPLRAIPKSILRDWPDIPFLKITTKLQAEEYLSNLLLCEINSIIADITYLTSGYCHVYDVMGEKVKSYRNEIRRHNKPKSKYGADPDSCGNGRCYYGTKSYPAPSTKSGN